MSSPAISENPDLPTFDDVIRHHASARPDAVAINFHGDDVTYAELDRLAQAGAESLLASGLRPGDRIAYIGKNSADFAILLGAAARGGFILAPLNWRLATAELEAILQDMEPRAIFLTETYEGLASQLDLHLAEKPLFLQARTNLKSYGQWLEPAPAGVEFSPRSNDDLILQLYTSGTTGKPKGVMLSHNCLTWQRRLSHAMWWDYSEPSEVLVLTMALGHIGGIQVLSRGLYHGGKTVILPEYDTRRVAMLIAEHRVTRLVVAPAMLRMLLDYAAQHEIDLRSLRCIQYGASPMPIDVVRRGLSEFSVDFVQVYGMTEMGGAVTTLPPDDHIAAGCPRMASVGHALPGVEIRVTGTDGEPLQILEIGQIEIRGGAVMKGYWRRPAETAEALNADGWLKTGDAGYLDGDGYLYLCDRIKDMICTGGENVYPAEVEQAILRNPDVGDVVVIGVPDDRWGEAVKAVVVVREGAQISPEAIIADARNYVAGFKLPKSVDFVSSIPRDGMGKVRRKDVREPYWTGHRARIG